MCFGGLLIIIALLANPVVLAKVFSPDGSISSTWIQVVIGFFEVALIGSGIGVIKKRNAIDPANIGLLLGSMVFGLISISVVEISYHYIKFFNNETSAKRIRDKISQVDDLLGWDHIPGASGRHKIENEFDVVYHLDQNGFRKVENKKKGDFAIYFFGDSFTFGYGVPDKETFSSIIAEQYLKNISVYNAAVSGYGIVQMFQRFLNNEHRIQKGDLVIFTPISVDIERNLKDFIRPFHSFFRFDTRSRIPYPNFVNNEVQSSAMINNVWARIKFISLKSNYTGYFLNKLRKLWIPDTRKEAQRMMEIAKTKTEERGGTFALIFLPEPGECRTGKYNVDLSGFDYFDVLNFFPKNLDRIKQIHFSFNDHWNTKGNALAAQAVVATLVREQLIDKKYLRNHGNVLALVP